MAVELTAMSLDSLAVFTKIVLHEFFKTRQVAQTSVTLRHEIGPEGTTVVGALTRNKIVSTPYSTTTRVEETVATNASCMWILTSWTGPG